MGTHDRGLETVEEVVRGQRLVLKPVCDLVPDRSGQVTDVVEGREPVGDTGRGVGDGGGVCAHDTIMP